MIDRFRVLITDRFDVDAYALLVGHSRIEVRRSATPTPTSDELEWAQALIIRSRTKIHLELLTQAKSLKVICTATSGFDHFDFSATRRFPQLTCMFTPEANAASACELTWALVLASARKIVDAHRSVKTGDWRRDSLMGTQLQGKTYGVIGLGRIGGRIAKVANAFGMNVIAYDPYRDDSYFAATQTQRVSLDEIFKLSDVVSIHVPATAETQFMIHRNLLESDEPNDHLIFVNTSRGTVIHEKLLIEALENKWITACGLDVFEREPLAQHSRLTQLPNVVLSPHIGATTDEAFHLASKEAAEKIITFVVSGLTADPLPPNEVWMHEDFAKAQPEQ